MFGFFMDELKRKNPALAGELAPYIDEYISGRAAIYVESVKPENFTGIGNRIPWIEEDKTEQLIDARENFYSDPDIIETYAAAGIPLPSEEEISAIPADVPVVPYSYNDRNQERLALMQDMENRREATSIATCTEPDKQQIEQNLGNEAQGSGKNNTG